jgi:hypothetical protein
MYEMRAGQEHPGGGLVWHVMAPDGGVTLCGQPLVEAADARAAESAGNCPRCMACVAELMSAAGR